ncbi:uncharacterized protein LOC110211618 [Phascolarctos cinereus]
MQIRSRPVRGVWTARDRRGFTLISPTSGPAAPIPQRERERHPPAGKEEPPRAEPCSRRQREPERFGPGWMGEPPAPKSRSPQTAAAAPAPSVVRQAAAPPLPRAGQELQGGLWVPAPCLPGAEEMPLGGGAGEARGCCALPAPVCCRPQSPPGPGCPSLQRKRLGSLRAGRRQDPDAWSFQSPGAGFTSWACSQVGTLGNPETLEITCPRDSLRASLGLTYGPGQRCRGPSSKPNSELAPAPATTLWPRISPAPQDPGCISRVCELIQSETETL